MKGKFNIDKFKQDYNSEYGTYDLEGLSEDSINSFISQLKKKVIKN